MIWILLVLLVWTAWIARRQSNALQAANRLRMKQVGEALGNLKLAQQQLASLHHQHRNEMDKRDERVTRIVQELSDIRWQRREGGRYFVTVEFDPRMLGFPGPGGFLREDLFYLAKYMGDQVTHEIASYKFVEKARETDREYRYPPVRKFSME